MTAVQSAEAPSPPGTEPPKRVVYLVGAGATQGCVSHLGSNRSLVMGGLFEQIVQQMTMTYYANYSDHPGIGRIVNDIVTPESYVDIEQLLSFLEESPSAEYRSFASDLKQSFSSVLRSQLDQVEAELAPNHSRLYAALVDMHSVPGGGETLKGIMTLNYDVFLEDAIVNVLGRSVDYGIDVVQPSGGGGEPVKVLKLHGSFGWSQDWPIAVELSNNHGFWIPPGIRKPKNEYPFNTIWGQARELLDCDVLRIIGCNLGPNDWDLVSLLFATRHTHSSGKPYEVEVISGPETVERVRTLFPYLEAKSLLELERIGPQIVGEVLPIPPTSYLDLSPDQRADAEARLGKTVKNTFEYWLTQRGEAWMTDLESVATDSMVFGDVVDELVS